jgi:hypothetical protein
MGEDKWEKDCEKGGIEIYSECERKQEFPWSSFTHLPVLQRRLSGELDDGHHRQSYSLRAQDH